MNARGLRVSCDVAVPLAGLAEMFAAIETIAAEEGVLVPTFAHAGDGNLHPSVLVEPPDGDDANPAAVTHAEHVLHRIALAALALGGTLSGEHGVGGLKFPDVPHQVDETSLAVHRTIRAALDPLGLLTPGRGV